MQTERQLLIGISTSVKDGVLEEKVCGIFHELGFEIGQRDIQVCQKKNNKKKIIRLKLVETGSVKTITHVNDLKDLFPSIDIDNL